MSKGLKTFFTLSDCLFGAVNLTKNADSVKYEYSGYGTRFDARSKFSLSIIEWSEIVICGVEKRSSPHIDKRKKDILIFGEAPTDA